MEPGVSVLYLSITFHDVGYYLLINYYFTPTGYSLEEPSYFDKWVHDLVGSRVAYNFLLYEHNLKKKESLSVRCGKK